LKHLPVSTFAADILGALFASKLTQAWRFEVSPPTVPLTVLRRRGWARTVAFQVDHVQDIEELIQSKPGNQLGQIPTGGESRYLAVLYGPQNIGRSAMDWDRIGPPGDSRTSNRWIDI